MSGLSRAGFVGLLVFSVCTVLHIVLSVQFADYDLFARLAVGRLIALNGEVPKYDVFSFSHTHPVWYDHEWLAGFLFYYVLQYFGESGLLVLALGAFFATFFFLYRAQRLLANLPGVGVLLLLVVAIVSCGMWAAVVRAQIISFFCFALLFWMLCGFAKNENRHPAILAIIPLIFLCWLNAHGGVVVGYGLLGLACVFSVLERRAYYKTLLLSAVLSAAMLFINPYGVSYLAFLSSAVGKSRPLIDEWDAVSLWPSAAFAQGTAILYFFIPLALLTLASCWRRVPKEFSCFLLCSLYFGLSHKRLLPFFYCTLAVCSLPLFSLFYDKLKASRREVLLQCSSALAVIAALYALINVSPMVLSAERWQLNASRYPVHSMQWLRCAYPGGNIMSSFNLGSFVLWQGYPQFLVAVDGRYEEVYEDSTVRKVQQAMSVSYQQRDDVLAEISPDFILLCAGEQERPKPAAYLSVYQDAHCSVLALTAPDPNDCKEDGLLTQPDSERAGIWNPHF